MRYTYNEDKDEFEPDLGYGAVDFQVLPDLRDVLTAPVSHRVDILRKAIELTVGARNRSYGQPYDNMLRTAQIEMAILPQQSKASDVALRMVALKLSRLRTSPGDYDTICDLIAYAAIYHECIVTEKEAHAPVPPASATASTPPGGGE